jgi:uncharacterized membrane protein
MDGFVFKAMILIRAQADQKVIKKAFVHASREFWFVCVVDEKKESSVEFGRLLVVGGGGLGGGGGGGRKVNNKEQNK